ncbi:DUF3833 domain-containing protein [Motiliproteus sediminis]|uniref:DUF3833 domain-containing protein n=1 Tax=Motiliproteus sediminis TaxID=1468178 RepID=UPI001FE550EA|nr:DUF3833 domain-containing protein [Motiliproteus sediminis]
MRPSRYRPLWLLLCGLLMSACSSVERPFQQPQPELVLEQFFDGKTRAWGLFEDRFGNLRRQFSVDIDGSWDGHTLTLDESFQFYDGEQSRRVWRITPVAAGVYEGRADDVIGTATGVVEGNLLRWQYQLDLKVGDSSWRVNFDDLMWQQDGRVMINRATVSRWGFRIGTLTLFFLREGPDAS